MQNDNWRFGAEKNDIVLDTDTYNEMDDQFAVLWALLSPERLNVRALTAAPFLNEQSASPADGMEKSFLELERIVELSGRNPQGLVWRGSAAYPPDRRTPVLSPAAFRIAELAREARRNGTRLKILAIAALTNVASALLLAPDIAESSISYGSAASRMTGKRRMSSTSGRTSPRSGRYSNQARCSRTSPAFTAPKR